METGAAIETTSHEREASFHDAWAAGTDLSDVRVMEAFEGPTALENKFILSFVGTLISFTVLFIQL